VSHRIEVHLCRAGSMAGFAAGSSVGDDKMQSMLSMPNRDERGKLSLSGVAGAPDDDEDEPSHARDPWPVRLLNVLNLQHNAHWMLSIVLFGMGVLNIIYGILDLLYFAYTSDNFGITLLIYVVLQDIFLAAYLVFMWIIHPWYNLYDKLSFENDLDVTGQTWSLLLLTAAQNLCVLLDITKFGLVQSLDANSAALRAYYWTQLSCGMGSGYIAWVVFRYYTSFVRKSPRELLLTNATEIESSGLY
jgi:hypothetical protein